ncbi:Stress-responsive protein Ish1 [Metarhizium album ARSEF 1941]|uniref:Stress-responsive protein Ish1 n=1 Tax=Metarhizium album (strain ARSEF 1941) TaxID=1081103 RepID=A0A0B2WYU7_METAS|nr:Stress-responsive protein Ish1 [Metarhizium album ARSEF 1941]KHN98602.1 Stress-responsive protein Ish1 [Metarhizium album ARSEF 1941]
MKISEVLLTAALGFLGATASSSWFPGSKAVYNKWHQTELERWLSDNDIPYPKASDRKDLETLVQKHWNNVIVQPYQSWDAARLSTYLRERGQDLHAAAEESKDSLISQVKVNWYESEEVARQAWANTKEWILDSWSESQLKAFCDEHGIPVPQPRHRDTLLQKARLGYETVAKKMGETAAYPGDWLYGAWSESDFKAWLDKYGIPAPQPSTRDKLVAAVRRNSRLAYLKAQQEAASASASARAAYATLTDMIIDAWGESQLKEFCDKNNIPVPQGTKENELRALVRKHRADILGDNVRAKASSQFGAATSNARNEYARATDSASLAAADAFNQATAKWSESRLKAYLDARGVPVPQTSDVDHLRALVRKHAHKAASGWQAWSFDDFSFANLKQYLAENGDAVAKRAAQKKDATREELISAAASAYSSASSAGGSRFASVTSYLSSATASVEKAAFDSWTRSELKAYLDSCGVPVPQGSGLEELKALARQQSTYFKFGTSSPSGTVFAKIGDAAAQAWKWTLDQLRLGSEAAQEKVQDAKGEL